MSIPNLYANTPLMVSSFAILLFLRGLKVQCSKGYNPGSNWNFQKILSDSERYIFFFYYIPMVIYYLARSRLVAVKGLRKVNVPCHYFVFLSVYFKRVQCRLLNLRKGHVALSNLRVKGHLK